MKTQTMLLIGGAVAAAIAVYFLFFRETAVAPILTEEEKQAVKEVVHPDAPGISPSAYTQLGPSADMPATQWAAMQRERREGRGLEPRHISYKVYRDPKEMEFSGIF